MKESPTMQPENHSASPLLKETYHCKDMPTGYFDLLPSGSVRQTRFPSDSRHNAAWDFLLCADGKGAYVSLCGELSQPLCVQLYFYDTTTGEMRFLFDVGREFFVNQREIPPSKIHTSLTQLPDGRILMTTHTTARSPRHPYWLFDSYYEHTHEAFQGSHLLIYNPANGEVRNLGIPVKHDSIYGGCYDIKHNAFFCTTFLKGNLFRIDLTTLEVRDLGQITEMGSYGIYSDNAGGFYVSSRTGHIFRIDADTLEIRDLGVAGAEPENLFRWSLHRVFAHWCAGPDGCFYFTMHFSDKLFRLNPQDGTFSEACSLAPVGKWRDAPPGMQKGHCFDSRQVLWFFVSRESANSWPGGALHLYRYDFLHGGEIEYMGMVGAEDHSGAIICHLAIDENDVIYFPDGNHGEDMAWMTAIDLKQVQSLRDTPRHPSRDAWNYCAFVDGEAYYPKDDFVAATRSYFLFRQYTLDEISWRGVNALSMVQPPPVQLWRLWEALPFAVDHTIGELAFTADGSLEAVAGGIRFALKADGSLQSLGMHARAAASAAFATPPELPSPHSFPARAGRQMLAEPTAAAPLCDGRWLLGSADGVFSLYDPATREIFALGAVGAQGKVHALRSSGSGEVVYGIMGDPDDLGHLIRFDLKRGLHDLGRVCRDLPDQVIASNTQLSALAVSFDGTRVAVGGAGRLACVYCYQFS